MQKFRDLDSGRKELSTLKARSFFIFIAIGLIFSIFFYQLIELMVLNNSNYITQSDKNRIDTVPIYPARGLIYDSEGNLIVENVVSQDLVLTSPQIQNPGKVIKEIKNSLNLNFIENSLLENINEIKGKKAGQLVLARDLNEMQIAKFQVEKSKWPEVNIKPSLKRFVLDDNLYSHLVGYLGPVTKEEIQDRDEFKYPMDYLTGKSGIEKSYEHFLRGSVGYKSIETDVYGNEIREISKKPPKRPEDLYLSINNELQSLAREELNERKGAVIGLESSTGLIRVLVSSPDFNPNLFNRTSKGSIATILTDANSPLFNRAISGNYPPASTLKPFIGLLALESEVIDQNYIVNDKGEFQIEGKGRKYRGWKEGGHGEVNLKKAIAVSSDVFFYELATSLTIDKISHFLSSFGFGSPTKIDLEEESDANLPNRNWKLGAIGESWFVGDTVNLGIGQGYITITPLQLAVATSLIINKGIAYQPRVVERVGNLNTTKEIINNIEIQDIANWDLILDSMKAVTNSWYGTAYNLSQFGKTKIAGKTGTAQIKSLTEETLSVREEYEGIRESISNRDHALFVGYGPIEDPKIVIVVIVENGESGSSVAAPIAQRLIDKYMEKQDE